MSAYITVGAHQVYSDLSSAITITNTEQQVHAYLFQALTQNVRYTLSNTTPTASMGFQMAAGDPPVRIDLDYGMSIRFIEETASAVLQAQPVV